MTGLDTNVLLRSIFGDDEKQAALARKYIKEKCTTQNPGYINVVVFCELYWVCKTGYRIEKYEFVDIVDKLLHINVFEIERPEIVYSALNEYKKGNADFADYIIGISNKIDGCTTTISCDKKACQSKGFTLLH
ncbi:MAG: PIN domain-containing protein [Calditrichaeota bacterium]|nr:MAG: PIN domain-containing protein [Calditrichota bacterium]